MKFFLLICALLFYFDLSIGWGFSSIGEEAAEHMKEGLKYIGDVAVNISNKAMGVGVVEPLGSIVNNVTNSLEKVLIRANDTTLKTEHTFGITDEVMTVSIVACACATAVSLFGMYVCYLCIAKKYSKKSDINNSMMH